MKRILIITYHFPPIGLAGSVRWTKFAKYLPKFGYEPIILSVKPISYYFYDHDLLNEVPDVKIYRSESLDPARIVYVLKGKEKAISTRLTRPSVLVHQLLFPDAKSPWIPFAYHLGCKIIKKEKPDLILATSPPYSGLLIGLLLKKRFSIPLVLEFRDPWATSIYKPPYPQKKMIAKLRKYLSANADRMLAVSKEVVEELNLNAEVLGHGYDPEDFKTERSFRFQFVFIGTTLGHEDEMDTFLDVVCETGAELYLIGNITLRILEKVSTIKNCHYLGILPHHKAMELINQARCLIYFYPAKKDYPTSRLYEYFGTANQILAISRHINSIRPSVEKHKIGITVPFDKQLIQKSVSRILAGKILKSDRPSSKDSFIELTKRLVIIFDEILKR